MTLEDWLAAQGRGAKSRLARATGLRWATIHDLARGYSTAEPKTAKRIERATGGQVRAADLLGLAENATGTDG